MFARTALLTLTLFGQAPLQCQRARPASQEREETPPEALWMLAERFRQGGDVQARRRTLEFLVERYPSSRFAERARIMLVDGDVSGDAGP